jgi:hypothetical protein
MGVCSRDRTRIGHPKDLPPVSDGAVFHALRRRASESGNTLSKSLVAVRDLAIAYGLAVPIGRTLSPSLRIRRSGVYPTSPLLPRAGKVG